MSTVTLKMAQIKEDLFETGPREDWTKEDPSDPGQYMTDPSQHKPTEDDMAQDMAKQWMGQMTRIGPEFYIEDTTASLLTALKALGLPMTSKEDVMTIAGLFIDDTVLMEHVGWLNDGEWMKLIQWLGKLPAHVKGELTMKMADVLKKAQQGNPALDLLMSLHDLNFEVAPGSPKTETLLSLLARSGGQGAGIAQQILSMDPASKAALFGQLDTAAYGVSTTAPAKEPQAPASPVAPVAPALPAGQLPPGKPTLEPGQTSPSIGQLLNNPEHYEPMMPKPEIAANPNTPLNVSIPFPKGSRGGNKGFQYILDNFSEVVPKLAQEMPDINWAQLGAEVGGIMPPSKTQGNEMTEMARAGNLVRVYDGGWTGMVLGSTEDGRLVLVNANGEVISTDPESAEVRVNANGQLKPTQF